jgi:3-methylcrotonyl-CoA carboxylase alpha subunit
VLGLRDLGPDGARVVHDGVAVPCSVRVHPDGSVWVNDPAAQSGWRQEQRLPDPELSASAAGPVAEVPGTVAAVLVAPGDRVTAGQKLVVLEAMKMEHPAVAEADGVVAEVHVEPGQYVDAHTVLVTLAPEQAPCPGCCGSPTAPGSSATASPPPARWSPGGPSTSSPVTGSPS